MGLLNRNRKPRPTPPPVNPKDIAEGMRAFADDMAGNNGPELADLTRGLWKDGYPGECADEWWAAWPTDEDRLELLPTA